MGNSTRKEAIKAAFRQLGNAIRGVRVDVTGSLPAAMPDMNFGVSVTNDSAMKLTAFFAGIRLISENVASLPKMVLRNTEEGMKTDRSHSVVALLEKPNPYTNKFMFWSVIAAWVKGWGNAYAVIRRDVAGTPIALYQVHPSCVTVSVSGGRKWYRIVGYDSDLAEIDGVYPDEDVLHFMELSLNGIVGVNTVIYNSVALGKSLATEKFASEFFSKGGNIKAVMETEASLGDDQYEAFMKHFSKAANNFDTPLLEYGIKYKALSVNPVAAQLIQSETMSIQDIARMLNIPPHMIAELSHATFSNIEHQTIQFVQYSLRPILKKFEVELENKLFFESERGKYSIKFSIEGLLRGDTAARSAYYHNAILDGYMSRNEVREKEGLERKEGLDDFLYPLNSGVVGTDGQIINPNEDDKS